MIICRSFEVPSKVIYIQHHYGKQHSPDHIYFSENMMITLSLIKAGYGISILPKNFGSDSALAYIPLADTDCISYGVFYKNNSKNPVLNTFLNVIHEWNI